SLHFEPEPSPGSCVPHLRDHAPSRTTTVPRTTVRSSPHSPHPLAPSTSAVLSAGSHAPAPIALAILLVVYLLALVRPLLPIPRSMPREHVELPLSRHLMPGSLTHILESFPAGAGALHLLSAPLVAGGSCRSMRTPLPAHSM